MQVIEGKLNQELLDVIDPFAEWFFQQDRSLIKMDGKADVDEHYTSIDYLHEMQAKEKVTGFPEVTNGMDLTRVDATPVAWRPIIEQLDVELTAMFGSKFNAVKMYYPAGGFMGWHHNANCPGYNILLSYTQNGNGFFRYQDPKTKEIVTLNDKPGWTAKVGYYGGWDEPDDIYWHTARAHEERLTLGYVIPNKEFWEMMVEDLSA